MVPTVFAGAVRFCSSFDEAESMIHIGTAVR